MGSEKTPYPKVKKLKSFEAAKFKGKSLAEREDQFSGRTPL